MNNPGLGTLGVQIRRPFYVEFGDSEIRDWSYFQVVAFEVEDRSVLCSGCNQRHVRPREQVTFEVVGFRDADRYVYVEGWIVNSGPTPITGTMNVRVRFFGADNTPSIRLPGAGLIFSSGNRRKWTEPPGKLLHDEVVPAQICRHRGVGLCGCEGVGNEGRLAGRRTCAEHVAVESAHGRLAVPLSPRQLVGASSAATVGPGGSLAGRWVWRLPRRIPVPHGGARPRGSRRWRRRDEDTRRGPTPRTAASCLVAFPPLAAKPTGRGLGRRRDGAD